MFRKSGEAESALAGSKTSKTLLCGAKAHDPFSILHLFDSKSSLSNWGHCNNDMIRPIDNPITESSSGEEFIYFNLL